MIALSLNNLETHDSVIPRRVRPLRETNALFPPGRGILSAPRRTQHVLRRAVFAPAVKRGAGEKHDTVGISIVSGLNRHENPMQD
jgi:hypothetical protein